MLQHTTLDPSFFLYMNRLHMMPVPSLNDIASSMKPGNRRLHTVPNTHNHLLPQNSSWAKKQNVATAVTPTATGKHICNCVARLDDDDETGCAAL